MCSMCSPFCRTPFTDALVDLNECHSFWPDSTIIRLVRQLRQNSNDSRQSAEKCIINGFKSELFGGHMLGSIHCTFSRCTSLSGLSAAKEFNVRNEMTLICAKSVADMTNISETYKPYNTGGSLFWPTMYMYSCYSYTVVAFTVHLPSTDINLASSDTTSLN